MLRPTMLAFALIALAATYRGAVALEVRDGIPLDSLEGSSWLNVSESSGVSDPTSAPEAYFWGFLTITPDGAYTLGLFQTTDKRDGPQATLTFAAGIDPSGLQSGTVIQVLGEYDASAGTLVVTAPPEAVEGGSTPPPPRRLLPSPPRKKTPPSPKKTPTDELYTSVYAIKSLTYILSMCGKTNNLTASYVRSMWGYTGQATSMQNYMSAITHGGVSFTTANNIVIGPITVPCTGTLTSGATYNSLACDGNAPWGWQQAADKIAQQQYGINPAAYPHRIMFIPNIQNCYWIGLGSQACAPNSCSVWINRGSGNIAMDALAHELGHNIGMLHSGLENDNYGDHSCVMGSWSGLRYYNAPVQWAAGFAGTIAGGDLTSTSQMPAGSWISFAIPAIAKSINAMLRLSPGVTGTTDTYFVSFRAPIGFDSGMPGEAKNRVQLHIYNGGTSYAARQQSWLQTYMGAGSYWPQPTQYPTINRGTRAVTPKIMVTVDRLDTTNNIAFVRVCRWNYNQAECANTRLAGH